MRKSFDDAALESRFITEDMNAHAMRSDIPFNLPDVQRAEALALRNKLLMYRLRTLGATRIAQDQEDRKRSGRFNQTVVPLLSVAPTEEMRTTIRSFAERCEERTRAFRSLSLEAEILAVASELATREDDVAVGRIADLLEQRMLGEFDRPITPRLVGQVLRRDLGFHTYKKHGTYVLPTSEHARLVQLAERYGVHHVRL